MKKAISILMVLSLLTLIGCAQPQQIQNITVENNTAIANITEDFSIDETTQSNVTKESLYNGTAKDIVLKLSDMPIGYELRFESEHTLNEIYGDPGDLYKGRDFEKSLGFKSDYFVSFANREPEVWLSEECMIYSSLDGTKTKFINISNTWSSTDFDFYPINIPTIGDDSFAIRIIGSERVSLIFTKNNIICSIALELPDPEKANEAEKLLEFSQLALSKINFI